MQTNNQRLDNILKILIIVLLLILMLQLMLTKGYSHCDKCRFEYEGKNITSAKLLDTYEKECFSEKNVFENFTYYNSSASTISLDSSVEN